MAYVFLDESGIHKLTGHSTFVLVYIEIEDYDKIEKDVIELERRLAIPAFHWSETVWHVKEKFMDAALQFDFTVKVAVVENPVHPVEELERILSHMIIEHHIHGIYIDWKKPKWYERRLKKILRDKGISVKTLKTVHDRHYAGYDWQTWRRGWCDGTLMTPREQKLIRIFSACVRR